MSHDVVGAGMIVSSDLKQDLQNLAAWWDGEKVDDLATLERRLLARLPDVPSDLHYPLLELIGDLAASFQVVTDAELYDALLLLAVSQSDPASVRASILLFRDFHDSRYIDRVRNALRNTENPGFFDALIALAKTAATGRIDATQLLESAISDDDVDVEAREAIVAALRRSTAP